MLRLFQSLGKTDQTSVHKQEGKCMLGRTPKKRNFGSLKKDNWLPGVGVGEGGTGEWTMWIVNLCPF